MPTSKSSRDRATHFLFFVFLIIALTGWSLAIDRIFFRNKSIPPHRVWQEVEYHADQYDLDPRFVYSLVFAESSFRPRAENTGGKGIMQVSRPAWGDMSEYPYDENVWDWKINIEVGVAYLAWCRDYLEAKEQFSYPLLAACYHKGPDEVRRKNFDIDRLKKTNNRVYARLYAGEMAPVEHP